MNIRRNKDTKEQIVCFSDNLYEIEEVMRNHFLEICNVVRFTSVSKTTIGFLYIRKHGGVNDKKFIETIDGLNSFLIKKITNNKLFNDIVQGKNKQYTHYFYKLSEEIKNYINKESLLFDYETSKFFYGFEDPTFYIDDTMIGCVVSHEDKLILYLNKEDKEKLEKRGLIVESKNYLKSPGQYLEIRKK